MKRESQQSASHSACSAVIVSAEFQVLTNCRWPHSTRRSIWTGRCGTHVPSNGGIARVAAQPKPSLTFCLAAAVTLCPYALERRQESSMCGVKGRGLLWGGDIMVQTGVIHAWLCYEMDEPGSVIMRRNTDVWFLLAGNTTFCLSCVLGAFANIELWTLTVHAVGV